MPPAGAGVPITLSYFVLVGTGQALAPCLSALFFQNPGEHHSETCTAGSQQNTAWLTPARCPPLFSGANRPVSLETPGL